MNSNMTRYLARLLTGKTTASFTVLDEYEVYRGTTGWTIRDMDLDMVVTHGLRSDEVVKFFNSLAA